jgi:hypothetical protein
VYFATIDHIMGYGHRYFFPILPVLSLLSGLGLSMTLESQAGPRIKTAFLLCALLAFALGFVKTYQAAGTYLSYARGMESAHILLGRALALTPWRSAPVIAIADAGAVPYYSELETVDTFGLNNPIVARNFHGDRSAYVLSQDPSVVILISKYENSFDSPFSYENMLFRSCIRQGFTRHVTFVFQKNYYLWVIWRPISQDADILEAVLKRASEHSHEMNR